MPAHTKSRLETKAQTDAEFIKPAENIVCDLCRVYYRAEVEERYRRGEDPRILSATYGISVQLIRQHMTHLEASVKLEATVESIGTELNLWRERVHRLYSAADAMLSVIQEGLVKEIDSDGNIILEPLTIKDIKPAMDVILKAISAGTSLAETFAKLHQLYKEDERSGPVFNVTYVNVDRSIQPVVIDRRTDHDEQSSGAAVRFIAGNKIVDTTEQPKPEDMLKIVESYLAGEQISAPQYIGNRQNEDYTRPIEFDVAGTALEAAQTPTETAGPADQEQD
jgi:hypothetical protein